MFTSMSTLSFSSTSSISSNVFNPGQKKNIEEKAPWLAEGEAEKRLAITLAQTQRNEITQLNLSLANFGRFYEQAKPSYTLSGHQCLITCLAALPNGQLASGSRDATIKLWDLTSRSCLFTLQGHASAVVTLVILPNSQLASGSSDKTIKIWNLASHSCFCTLQGHTYWVSALAALPNGQLASGSYDYTIKIWDLASRSCLFTLQGHAWGIWTLAALPNGLLASGSSDHTIKIWDLASRSCVSTLQRHASPVSTLTILPSGQVACAYYDNLIKLWDMASNSCLSVLQGHTSYALALTTLPNGHFVSGSEDTTIKLWDLDSHSCLSTLGGHAGSVYALAVLSNGLIASGSLDKTIKIWNPKIVSLSSQALQPILKALRTNTSVTSLNLSGNSHVADNIIDPLIELFASKTSSDPKPNTTLKTIDLRQTGVTWPGIEKLQKAINAQSLSVAVLFDETAESKAAQERYAEEEEAKAIQARHDRKMAQASKKKKTLDAKLEAELDKYRCPITNLIMLDPILTPDGYTYEREAIEKWLKTHATSPKTKVVLLRKLFTPNEHFREVIQNLLKEHPELWDSGEVYESLELEIKWVRAIKSSRINELNILLSMDKRLVKIAIEDHKSLLSFALEQKSLEMARLAIHRLDKSIQDIPELEAMNRMELFRKAAHYLGAEGAKFIGDALEIKPSAYQTELWWGIQHRDATLVQATLGLKANPADLNEQGLRPIHVAAEMEDEKVISVLAQHGQIDNVDAKGYTALHRAILKNQSNQVRLLTAYYADVRKATPQNLTPLELSFEQIKAKQDSLPIARNLLEYKADPNFTGSQRQPLLLKAMEAGLLDWVGLLVSYGANVNIPNSKGEMLIHRAFLFVGKELTSILQILVQGKANLEVKDKAGYTPLLKAASIEPPQPEAVAILLKAKANVEAVDAENGNSSLHFAVEKGSDTVVKLLMEAGANPAVRNRANLTPLKLAKNARRSNVIEVFRTKSLERRIRPFLEPLQKQITEQKLEIERLKQALAKTQPVMPQGPNDETVTNTPLALMSSPSGFWSLSASPSPSTISVEISSVTSAATQAISS